MTSLRIFIFIWILSLSVLAQGKAGYVKDELLVKFRKGTVSSKALEVTSRLGLARLQKIGDTGWDRVRIAAGKDVASAAEIIRLDPAIEAVQPNFYYQLQTIPNDPEWANSGLWGMPKISGPAAWDLTTGSSAVVVANIDTGMRYTHEDLAANMWTNPGEIQGNGVDDDNNGFADDYYGYDFFVNDPDPLDEHGHGTHVGGTIGAVGNNALGVVGVNWNVRIMAIKIFGAPGSEATSAMLVNAYNYIRMMKLRGVNIRVTNNSYSGTEPGDRDLALKDGIDAMGNAGILNVFAAGNNAWNNDTAATPAYPATFNSPSILAVASSASDDSRSSFSNYGAVSVDLAAPGTAIFSTTFSNNSSYGISSGTSMAAPHVAGAAALLAAYDPSLSATALKATLMNTVDPLPGWTATPTKANGRLNVFNALQNRTGCSMNVSLSPVTISRKGGFFDVEVASGPNCEFPVTSDRRWISTRGSGVTSGNTTVRVFVSPSQLLSRTGTLTIGGQNILVQQGSSTIFPKS